jgi:hypothetical protein
LQGKHLLAVLTCLAIISVYAQVLPHAEAHNGLSLSAYTATPPTIDGNIQAGEWAAAATANIGPFGPGNAYGGMLYMMNDGVNLYIGVIITGDGGLGVDDNVRFYFDNNHVGGTSRHLGDDDIIAQGTSTNIGDIFYDGTFDQWDTLFGGTADGQVASSRQGNLNMFELSHPLDDADNAHDFSLSAGQTVGFALTVVIDTNWITNIPGFGTYADPSTYANYVIASQAVVIPEYPFGVAVLAIFMILSYGLIRRRTSTRTLN